MTLHGPSALKPHDAASLRTPAARLKPPTKMMPADKTGIISHPKKDAGPAALAVPDTQHDRLVQQAQKWVAQTFFGTMLKQMRQSPFKSELFSGGRGGQAFNEMLDQRLVEHMSRGAGKQLVQVIARKLEAGAAYRKQQGTPGSAAAIAKATGGQPSHTGDQHGHPPDSDDSRRRPKASGKDPENPYRNVRIHVAPAVGS